MAGAGLPVVWEEQVDELVRKITTKQKELSVLHRKRLLVSFDDSAEASQERCGDACLTHLSG